VEANKDKYFVDGFLIKHFDIFPIGFDKNNLFYEQKTFLIYLSASIPSIDEWTIQMSYLTQKDEIENLKLKDIKLSQEDLSLVNLQGGNVENLKKERLKNEKEKKLKELNEKFGIKEEANKKEIKVSHKPDRRQNLWDMLECKGLIDNKE